MNRGDGKKWLKPSGLCVLVILLGVIPLFIKSPYILHVLIMAGVSVILASSLRFIANSGRLSLAHGGMMSIGAYTTALMVMNLGVSSWLALISGGIAAGMVALLVGFPFVRIKGVYFALVTVFLAEVIRLVIEEWKGLTGGSSGIINIPPPDTIHIPMILNMDFSSKSDFYYLILLLVLLTLLVLYAIEHSRIGVTSLGIAQSEPLSKSIGVNTAGYKVLIFCIGSFFAGLAGGFYSQYISAITPSVFGFTYTIYIVLYMVLGGVRSFAGPILGAVVLTLLPESFRIFEAYQPFVFAGLLIVTILFMPEGLISLPSRLRRIAKARFSHA